MALADREIIPSPDPTCDQYFDAGYVYAGASRTKHLTDQITNTQNPFNLIVYRDELTSPKIDFYKHNIIEYNKPEF